MRQRRRIHVAFVAALLLAQFELPVAHGIALSGEGQRAVAIGGLSLEPASPASPHGTTHDASRCPICLALSQVRSGVDRLAPLVAARSVGVPTPLAPVPAAAPPRAVERISAPPRAPPLRALSLA